MKLKFNTSVIVNVFIIGIFLIGLLNILSLYGLFGHWRGSGVDPSFRINHYEWKKKDLQPPNTIVTADSLWLIAQRYKKLSDSIATIKKLRNGYGDATGQFLNIGIEQGVYNDTCSTTWFYKKIFHHKEYYTNYILLSGWDLNVSTVDFESIDSGVFHVEHGKSYIRKLTVDDKIHIVTDEDYPVKFRYDKKIRGLLIPVNRKIENTLNILLIVIGILWVIWCLYLIAAFIKFFVDILKGIFFTTTNLKRLKIIAWTLLTLPVAELVFNLIMRVIFWSYFTSDVRLSPTVWQDAWKPIGLGFIFLLLYRAFKQGKKMKEEQELTI